MNHTPGPWKITKHSQLSEQYYINGKNGAFVGVVAQFRQDNIELAAAAPEMLELLREARERDMNWEFRSMTDEWHNRCNVLLMKLEDTNHA